jgi:uncharacterized protein YeaO (DUF488 family)
MIINTSYFAQLKKIKNPVSISSSSPSWYNGPEFKALAPPWWLVKAYKNGVLNVNQYTEEYEKQLKALNIDEVIKGIKKLYLKEEEITLLCYEKSSDFCHRHLVARWFNLHGYNVTEKTF